MNVQSAEPICVLVLVPPHLASFSMSKRIIDDELVHAPPPEVVNCQSGVTPLDSHPQAGRDGGGGGGGADGGLQVTDRLLHQRIAS